MKMDLVLISFFLFLGRAYSQIVPEKELLITHLSVVNSEEARTGAWSFPQFMKFLAGPNQDASVFTENWLMNWGIDSIVNGKISPGRPAVLDFTRSWPRRPDGRLDLQKAPFILNAIINRIDMTALPAFDKTAQLRFVFQALNSGSKPTQMMVIFEFNVPFTHNTPQGQVMWAKAWNQLGKIQFGPQYNALLAKITTRVFQLSTLSDLALFRFRTGDGIFSRPPEMRSFCINSKRTSLQVCQSPHAPSLEYATPEPGGKQSQLIQWIQTNADKILKGEYKLPIEFQGTHHPVGNFKWAQVLENSPDPKLRLARQKFALNACNGCHNPLETQSIVMIGDRELGTESRLAPFVKLDLVNRQKIYRALLNK